MVPAEAIQSARGPERRGNTVLLRVRDEALARAALRDAAVRADSRDSCVRVSPHIYNDSLDLERLVGALKPHF
jgi:kynureninase